MRNRVTFVLTFFVYCNVGFAQSDGEFRALIDRSLLVEEPKSALFYLKQIKTWNNEDHLRRWEAAMLPIPPDLAFDPRTDALKHSQASTPAEYFNYLVALRDFHSRRFKSVLTIQPGVQSKSPVLHGKIEFLLGKAFLELNLPDSALQHLNKALKIFRPDSVNTYVQIAKLRNYLGRTLRRKRQVQKAVAQYLAAIQILENSPLEKWDDLGRIINNLGIAYADLGQYENAKTQYLKAVDLKEKYSPDSLNRAITYSNLASFYSNYGNYLKSQEYHKKSFALLDSTKKATYPQMVLSLNNYGVMLMSMREPALAIEALQKSILYSRKIEENEQGLILPTVNLSMCMGDLDRKSDARALLLELDSLINSLPPTDDRRIIYLSACGNSYSPEYPKEAAVYYRKALTGIESAPSIQVRRQTELMWLLGWANMNDHQPLEAIALFRRAKVIAEAESVRNKEFLTSLYTDLGVAYSDRHRDSAAYFFGLSLRENSLESTGALPDRPLFVNMFDLIATHYQIARLHWRDYQTSGDVEALHSALPSVQASIQLVRLERNRMTSEKDKIKLGGDVAAVYDLAALIYLQLFKKTGNQTFFEGLYNSVEQSRQQTMMTTLRTDKITAFAGVTSALFEKESTVNYAVKHLTAQLSAELELSQDASPELVNEYIELLSVNERQLEHMTDSLKSHLPDYYNLKYNNTIASLDNVQHDLLQKTTRALVQYHVVDSSLIILVSHASFRTAVQVPYYGVKKLVTAARNQVFHRDAGWSSTATSLYSILVQPVDSIVKHHKMRVRELLIIPDEELFFIPFEFLRASTRDPYVIETKTVNYGLSVTLLWQKATDARKGNSKKEFVGFVPTFDKDGSPQTYALRGEEDGLSMTFDRLQSTSSEVNAIAQTLSKAKIRSNVLEGENASEKQFKDLKLLDFSYIHLATHGFVNMDHPERSGLAFSKTTGNEDDILFTSEVYNIKLNADLVCLSACETGLGKIYKGEGLMGLTRGFLYAGARSLLVSLWKVDDKSTAIWMEAFYSEIARGSSPGDAARAAKLRLMKNKSFAHPFYWAPFVVIGG